MNIFKRSLLYITRKRARSFILLLFVFVTSILMLAGLSIRQSAAKAADEVRKSMITGFVIEIKTGIPGEEIYKLEEEKEDGEVKRILTAPLLLDEDFNKILEINEITGYYKYTGQELLYTGLDTVDTDYAKSLQEEQYADIDITDPGITDEERSFYINNKANTFFLVSEGQYHPFFINGALELVKGRHLVEGDSQKVVVSDVLAEKNGLKIGDAISSYQYDSVTGETFGDPDGKPYEAEIVGLFHVNFDQSTSEWMDKNQLFVNGMFAPMELRTLDHINYNVFYKRTYLSADSDYPIENVTCYVDNPDHLDSIIQKVKDTGLVDSKYYDIKRYDSDYETMAGPLRRMVRLSTALAVIMAIGCLVSLSLILTMWMRGRKKEIGILASIGVKKRNMIAQFLLECMLISVAAFILGGVFSKPVTNVIGQQMSSFVSPKANAQPYEVIAEDMWSMKAVRTSTEEVQLTYHTNLQVIGYVFLMIMLVVLVSVYASSFAILKYKPREIIEGR